MKNRFAFLLTLLVAAIIFSCTPEEGPQGKTGASGADGNANVHTYIFTDSLQLAWSSNEIRILYDSVFTIPDSIRESGLVLVYMEFYSYPDWWYMSPGLAAAGIISTRHSYNYERLFITALDPDGTLWSGGTLPPVSKIKVVLASPSQVTMMRKTHAMPDFSDHDATMEALGVR